MSEKWITKKNENGESKHIRMDSAKTVREKTVVATKMGPTVEELEKQAWGILDDLSKVSTVDQLLLELRKYSGTLGDYSAFNSMLIGLQDPKATIVRSKTEWGYFGRELKEDAKSMNVLFPIGIPPKEMPGKMKKFIEEKRNEGLDDDAITELVAEKLRRSGNGFAHYFGTGDVYDISQTNAIPGKETPIEDVVSARELYKTLKGIAQEHYTVEEDIIFNGARGYTGHSGEGQRIVVMKIPGEDVNVLHTLIHEMSHARLEHLYRDDLMRGQAESEAELSTYLVGSHFGFDFKDDSAAYIKSWLDRTTKDKGLGKENLDRVMNNARWLIQEISSKLP